MFSNSPDFAVDSACQSRSHSLNLSIVAASIICKLVSGLQNIVILMMIFYSKFRVLDSFKKHLVTYHQATTPQ